MKTSEAKNHTILAFEKLAVRYELGLLRRIDKGISHLPLFRVIGDHMLLYFERVEEVMLSSSSESRARRHRPIKAWL